MAKRKKSRAPGCEAVRMNEACRTALAAEGEVRLEARARGLSLRVTEMRSARHATSHWMFNRGDWRVLNYWPGSGTCWSQEVGRHTVPDVWAALDMAQRILNGDFLRAADARNLERQIAGD
jgi:hypothetical protein